MSSIGLKVCVVVDRSVYASKYESVFSLTIYSHMFSHLSSKDFKFFPCLRKTFILLPCASLQYGMLDVAYRTEFEIELTISIHFANFLAHIIRCRSCLLNLTIASAE